MRNKNLEIFRGDTYALKVQLTRDDPFSIVGTEVKMSFRFTDDDSVHTFIGNILDSVNKIVSFSPTTGAVAIVRSGTYDIQVVDGGHPLTYKKGKVDILQDITP